MRNFIKKPIPEIFQSWSFLNKAVDAHISGKTALAESFFEKADIREVWEWLDPAWTDVHLNVVVRKPNGDTKTIPKPMRDPDRAIRKSIRDAVLRRDGYRCRYCGIPVVDAKIRKLAHQLYPSAVPWLQFDKRQQHAGFQCLWLQYDHVEPHSHGGLSSEENIVVSCALCNFGKFNYTLRQLDLLDPRLRAPVPSDWDGLERIRIATTANTVSQSLREGVQRTHSSSNPVTKHNSEEQGVFFLPGAWLDAGYLNTPPIEGKNRWFKLGPGVSVEKVTRKGVEGYLIFCDPELLRRRRIRIDPLRDQAKE